MFFCVWKNWFVGEYARVWICILCFSPFEFFPSLCSSSNQFDEFLFSFKYSSSYFIFCCFIKISLFFGVWWSFGEELVLLCAYRLALMSRWWGKNVFRFYYKIYCNLWSLKLVLLDGWELFGKIIEG